MAKVHEMMLKCISYWRSNLKPQYITHQMVKYCLFFSAAEGVDLR